ncbi:unnamed protein product, partial [Symbiodinium necroappetens]
DYAEQSHGTTPRDAEEGARRPVEEEPGALTHMNQEIPDEDTTRATLKINDTGDFAHVNPDPVRPGEHGDGFGGTHYEHHDEKFRERTDGFINYHQNDPQDSNTEGIDYDEFGKNFTTGQGECEEGGGFINYNQNNPQNSNTEDIDFDESGKNTTGQGECEGGGGFINYNLDDPQNSEAEDIEHGEFGKNTTGQVKCDEGGGHLDYNPEAIQDHNTEGTECNSYGYDVDSGEEELAHAMVVDNFLTGHARHDPKDCEQRAREAIEGGDYTYKTLEEVM